MKHRAILTVTSLLSLLLFSIHVTDDIVRGYDSWGPASLFGVLIMAVWLYGALVVAERRSGLIVILLGGLFSAGMPVIHMRANVARSSGGFLFIWTLFALGALGAFSLILAVRELRSPQPGSSAATETIRV